MKLASLSSVTTKTKTFKDSSGNVYSESDFSSDELFDEKGRRKNPITGEVIETTAEEKPSEEETAPAVAEPTTADNSSEEPEQKEEPTIEEKIQAAVSKLGNALDSIPIEKERDEVKAYIDGLGAGFANELSNIVMEYYDATVAKAKAAEPVDPNADMIKNVNQLLAGTGIQITNADELNQFIQNAADNAKNAYYQSILFGNPDIMNAYNSLMAQQQSAV